MIRKKNRTVPALLAVLLTVALLGGCGSGTNDGVPPASGTVTGATTVGINVCTSCHTAQTADWLASRHANAETGSTSPGVPTLAQIVSCTKNCHDPNRDSANIIAAGIGSVARPVVGCEACHGGGSLHNGSGPISLLSNTSGTTFAPALTTTPNPTTISVTANNTFTRTAGDFIAEGFVAGRVITAIGFANPENNGSFVLSSVSALTAIITTTTLKVEAGDGNELITSAPVIFSGQLTTCTSCHELLDLTKADPTNAAAPAISAHDAGGSDSGAYASPGASITDTHYAKVITYGTDTLTGYAMDFSSATVCADCHDPHKNADIAREWALSPHAITAPSGAWGRSNWSQNPTCQRCHTTTGYAAYADALRMGTATAAHNILYGTLATPPVPSTLRWKPEMLQCRGCHTDSRSGSLRNPGAYTADYSYNFYTSSPTIFSVASHAYPDLAGSNVCIPCHSGRENGETIQNMNSGGVAAVDFSNRSLISGHHFQSAAVMFGTAGYNFLGRDYSNPTLYKHDKIGSASAPNTGSNGPCVGCHMSRPNKVGNHLFMPVSKDETETLVTGVASEVCTQCHGPNDGVVDMVNHQQTLFADAQSALQYVLEQAGFFMRTGSSSIFKVRDSAMITAGTVTVVNGSPVVTGIKTNWTSVGLDAGVDKFAIANDAQWYTIASIDSPTQITLATPFTGVTNTSSSGTSYVIDKVEDVTVTNGSPTVIGTGTNWVSAAGLIEAGDKFRVDSNGVWYTIASVTDDTHIILTTNYAGASLTTPAFTLKNTTTATATNGSATVNIAGANLITLDVGLPGSGTTGDYFRIDSDGTWYKINNRTSSTLTLSSNYTGTTVTGPYTIIRSGSNGNWLTRGDTDITGNTTGKNNMGAAVNLTLFVDAAHGEPAAFVHNRYYTKRLFYDAIDWLDDGRMNYSTGATLNAVCGAGTPPAWCPNAITYVLPNGVLWNYQAGNGTSAERP